MRAALQKLGTILVVAGVVIWIIAGAPGGFYVVTEEIAQYDIITEISYTNNHPKFLPGIEPLFLGLISGGSFWLVSFLFSKVSKPKK